MENLDKNNMNVAKAVSIIQLYDYRMRTTMFLDLRERYENEFEEAVRYLEDLERSKNEMERV